MEANRTVSENTSAASTFSLAAASIETGEGLNHTIALRLGEGVAPRFFENCPAFPAILPYEMGERGPRARASEGGLVPLSLSRTERTL